MPAAAIIFAPLPVGERVVGSRSEATGWGVFCTISGSSPPPRRRNAAPPPPTGGGVSAPSTGLPLLPRRKRGLIFLALCDPSGTQIDFTKGHLMPYLENNQGMFRNPAKSPGKVYLTFDGGTGGYGYNYRYLAPLLPVQGPQLGTGPPSGGEMWSPVRV